MSKDKFTATWVSHSSINDFLQCPRAYYLKNIYKDPQTNHKVQIMAPALALGQAVHEVLESLSTIPTDSRFKQSLMEKFDKVWKNVRGIKGGFLSDDIEQQYKKRGEEMIRRVMSNPGPVARLAVKIQEDLPYFYLSENDNIILCGKIDWLEYLPDTDSVHIVDFKTSQREEKKASLQLPIYHLLVHHCQKRKVDKLSYWYLGLNDDLTEKNLPDLETAYDEILSIAKKIKLARSLNHFKCPQGDKGCYACKPFEKILRGEAHHVGTGGFNRDIYILKDKEDEQVKESVIL